jgi:hypothetical protein
MLCITQILAVYFNEQDCYVTPDVKNIKLSFFLSKASPLLLLALLPPPVSHHHYQYWGWPAYLFSVLEVIKQPT